MKSIYRKKSVKKYYIGAMVLLILLTAAVFLYVYAFNGSFFGWKKNQSDKDASINYQPPTEEQKKAGDDIKQNSNNSDQPPAPTPVPGTNKSQIEMTITAANQNGSMFQLRSLIYAIAGDGTCTLTLSKGGQVVTKTAEVQALASTSTCKGFDIPTSELSPGTWSAALKFENETLTATTSKTDIVIN